MGAQVRTCTTAALRFLIPVVLLLFSLQSFSQVIFPKDSVGRKTLKEAAHFFSNDSAAFPTERQKFLNLLEQKGYLFSVVSGKYDSISFYLGAKTHFLIDSMFFSGFSPSEEYSIRNKLSTNRTIHGKKNILDKIIQELRNNGFPFAQFQFKKLRQQENNFLVDLHFSKNNYVEIGEVKILSETLKRKGIIKQIVGLKKGDKFSSSRIKKVVDAINQQPFLKTKKPPAIYYAHGKAYLNIYAEKKPAGRFDGVIGLAQNEESKLELNGYLNLLLQNSFGTAEKLSLHWNKTGDALQKLNAEAHFPYLWSSPWGIAATFRLTQMDSSFSVSYVQPSISRKLPGQQFVFLSFEQETVNPIGNPEKSAASNATLWGFGYNYMGFDNNINPTKGFAIKLSSYVGTRKTTDEETKLKAKLEATAFLPIQKRLCLKLASANALLHHQSGGYSDAELLRLGGFSSLRGFYEDEFTARQFSLNTVELRYILDSLSNLSLFSDLAFFKTKTGNTMSPWAVGFSANIGTRAGILGISYAVGKRRGENLSLKNGKFHFGYANYF